MQKDIQILSNSSTDELQDDFFLRMKTGLGVKSIAPLKTVLL